jgi:N-acyl-phosphatidylethanolamine-hydrolysing phospholipase D
MGSSNAAVEEFRSSKAQVENFRSRESTAVYAEKCRLNGPRPLLLPALVGGLASMAILCITSFLRSTVREDLSHLLSNRPTLAPAEHATTLAEDNTTFVNPWPSWTGTATPLQIARLLLSREYIRSLFPTFNSAPPVPSLFPTTPPSLQATWLGHSGMFMHQSDFVYLVDPILSRHISPLPLFGPLRLNAPPFDSYAALAEAAGVQSLDFVLLSHAHYDHLSVPDLVAIESLWKPHYYVPHGVDRYLTEKPVGIPQSRVTTLQWWQDAIHPSPSHGMNARITLTPAQHWSRRGLFDTNLALHGGFTVATAASRVYFVGDSGYVPMLFEDIGRLLGPFDFAAIPIGAYAPRDIHAASHMDPEMALRVHMEAKCASSVAIHWGTFQLTTEPVLEPCEVLSGEIEKLEMSVGTSNRDADASMKQPRVQPSNFKCVSPGEVLLLAA